MVKHNATLFQLNQIVEYQCEHGFKHEQYSNITCSKQGMWIGEIPSCTGIALIYFFFHFSCKTSLKTMTILCFTNTEVMCDEPEFSSILHLSYTMTGTSYLSEMNVTCQKGYHSQNEMSQLMCNESATWEGDLPFCTGNMLHYFDNLQHIQ